MTLDGLVKKLERNTERTCIISAITVKLKLLENYPKDIPLPVYSAGNSGFDLRAVEPAKILPYDRRVIKTGLAVEIPTGYEIQIRPRSGLALKHGITVLNTPGTADASYRGEIQVILFNTSREPFLVNIGDRIAQGVLSKVEYPSFEIVEELSETKRGEGGFGSTGLS